MEKVKTEYAAFLERHGNISVADLLTSDDLSYKEYSKSFKVPEELESVLKSTKEFGEKHGIWQTNSEVFVTLAVHTFAKSKASRLLELANIINVSCTIDDLWGRDKFKKLSETEQSQGQEIIDRLSKEQITVSFPENAHPLEKANAELLLTLKKNSTEDWFERFLKSYTRLISYTNKDWETEKDGKPLTVNEYIKQRRQRFGVWCTFNLIEYGQGEFLDLNWIDRVGLEDSLKKLHEYVGNLYGLTKDFLTFEKEVIENDIESNILVTMVANFPILTFLHCMVKCSEQIRYFLKLYLAEKKTILNKLSQMTTQSGNAGILERYINGIDSSVQSCWAWYVENDINHREASIWKEIDAKYVEIVRELERTPKFFA